MFVPAYLSLSRHSIYYFRWPIPTPPNTAKSYVKFSLGTRDPREALRLARSMANLGEFFFNNNNPALFSMDHAQLKPFIQSLFAEALNRFKERVNKTGPIGGASLDMYQNSFSTAQQAITDQDHSIWFPEVTKKINDIIINNKLEPITAENIEQMKWLYIQGYKSYCEEALSYNLDAQAISLSSHNLPVYPSLKKVEAKNVHTLSSVVDQFLAEKSVTGGWSSNTKNERIAQLNYLIELLGANFNLWELNFTHANNVKQKLLITPRNRKKKEALGKLELLPALQDTLSMRTVNSYLTSYISLVTWAKNHGMCSANPFSGMKVNLKGEKKKKRAFTLEEMRTIIQALDKMREHNSLLMHHYWIGMVSIYSGTRVNEASSLYKKNIVQIDGMWCVDIRTLEPDQFVKNETSARIFPIHSTLIDKGFLDYVQSCDTDRLFPRIQFDRRNKYGRAPSRWYNDNFFKSVGVKYHDTSFHSLRHSFITYLQRARVPEDRLQAIVGHSHDTVLQQNYAEGYDINELKEHIEKLNYGGERHGTEL